MKKILLCSLLKPVDDPRMYEKLAISLLSNLPVKVQIAGYYSGSSDLRKDIDYFPIFKFDRLSVQRFLAPFQLFKLLFKLKPDIIINNSHDFLIVISLYKIFNRIKFIYDVQENYYFNIRCNQYLPGLARLILSNWIRMKEIFTSLLVDHFLLAERCYAEELPFIGRRYTVLENKYASHPEFPVKKTPKSSPFIYLLYSGTIAEHYGILDTLNFTASFYAHSKNIRLILAGHCPHYPTFNKVLSQIKDCPYVFFNIQKEPLPHKKILEAIQSADFGIINYHINPSTANRIPTRLYEYLACELPVLVQNHFPWMDLVRKANAGIQVDFDKANFENLYQDMTNRSFYGNAHHPPVFWSDEEPALIRLVQQMIRI